MDKNKYNFLILSFNHINDSALNCAVSWFNKSFILPSNTVVFLIASLLMSQIAFSEESLSLKQILLMPGDLTEAHTKLETKCESCHIHFDKASQAPLCLECHEEVTTDLKKSSGFHGQLSNIQQQNCRSCHSEHKGRNFDIVAIDEDHFNHNQTNFPLKGNHKKLVCKTCHINKIENSINIKFPKGISALPKAKGYRFKTFECGSCHENIHQDNLQQDNKHLTKLTQISGNQSQDHTSMKECSNCHNEDRWQSNDFDHSKTDFPLTGEHTDVSCQSCHIENKFEKELSNECSSCHSSIEPHLGVFGKVCNDCHTEKTWENNSYQHFNETGFSLKGKHNKLKCIDCHSEVLKPKTLCISCHLNDDVHQRSNGKKCQSCHNEKIWDKTSFEHSFDKTGFTLDGEHKNVNCESCHLPGSTRNEFSNLKLSETDKLGASIIKKLQSVRQCIDCHLTSDPHFAKLGNRCEQCHTTSEWNKTVGFNHDFTDFPLTASHQLLVCGSCHNSFDFSTEDTSCSSCHQSDDVHKGTLGKKCESCHNTSIWQNWQFDHSDQTDFPLDGAHKNLQCGLCHLPTKPTQRQPDKTCFSCHSNDDIHQGGFGLDCQQCHTEQSFDDLSF